MNRISSFLAGRWCEDGAPVATLLNPATEEPLAELAGGGDLRAALHDARSKGGPALRELSFAKRGEMLKQMSQLVYGHRDELIGLAIANGGNTRSDAKFDIDGASGTLAYYAELGQSLGDRKALEDGEGVQLSRSPRFFGRHLLLPRAGVAVHVNAFNFPAWGAAEKAACALLAGMPVLMKPATATALVAHRMCQVWIEAGALPEGAYQLLLGPVGDLFDHLTGQDVLAFTGGSETALRLKGDPRLLRAGVRVNVEADSLNAAVLGADAGPGSATYGMFLSEVARDVTQKAGQKCTAIRRVLVPRDVASQVAEDLAERMSAIKVGNPALEEVTMGPLATAEQARDVRAGLAALMAECRSVHGGDGTVVPRGVPEGKGYFCGPVLLQHDDPAAARTVHGREVFGPIATLLPYDGSAAEATDIVRLGAGGLVTSVYADDRDFVAGLVASLGPFHGRLYLGSEKVADKTPGPGTVLPQLVHGGPGRAGAGEELGGMRGMSFYMQRTAIEGDRAMLDALVAKL